MKTLAILSRDASQYEKLLADKLPDGVSAIQFVSSVDELQHHETIDILLAEPDLAALVAPHCQQLEWIQSTWAGVKPLMDLKDTPFHISGIKDLFSEQMLEYVLTYMLHFARQVDHFTMLKSRKEWQPITPARLHKQTVGIMGLGSIGLGVAKTLKQLGMHVVGMSQSEKQCGYLDAWYPVDEYSAFTQSLDYLICLLPHTVETEHMIGTSFLQGLPKHCVLINGGRGQVIDDNALLHALNDNQLKAAVLDVFAAEPLPDNHPFWEHPAVIITQHTAAISHADDIAEVFLRNLNLFMKKQELEYKIDPQKGY